MVRSTSNTSAEINNIDPALVFSVQSLPWVGALVSRLQYAPLLDLAASLVGVGLVLVVDLAYLLADVVAAASQDVPDPGQLLRLFVRWSPDLLPAAAHGISPIARIEQAFVTGQGWLFTGLGVAVVILTIRRSRSTTVQFRRVGRGGFVFGGRDGPSPVVAGLALLGRLCLGKRGPFPPAGAGVALPDILEYLRVVVLVFEGLVPELWSDVLVGLLGYCTLSLDSTFDVLYLLSDALVQAFVDFISDRVLVFCSCLEFDAAWEPVPRANADLVHEGLLVIGLHVGLLAGQDEDFLLAFLLLLLLQLLIVGLFCRNTLYIRLLYSIIGNIRTRPLVLGILLHFRL